MTRLSSNRGSRVNQFVNSSRGLPHTWFTPHVRVFHEVCPWHKSKQRSVVLVLCSTGDAHLVWHLNYFAIFIQVPVPKYSTHLCILSHTHAAVMAEICVIRFIGFHVTNTHLEGVSYYGAMLLFSNCLHIVVILTLNTLTDNKAGVSWV